MLNYKEFKICKQGCNLEGKMSFVYVLNVAIAIVLGYILCEKFTSKKTKLLYLGLVFISFTVISSARFGIGFDYFNYQTVLDQVTSLTTIPQMLAYPSSEIGFTLLMKMVSFFSTDVAVLYVVVNIIMYGAFVIFVYFYVSDASAWVAVSAFVCLSFFYMTMNLVRQGFVLIIALYAIEFIKKRNLWAFLAAILLAASIHKSALILIPFYFLANVKFNWKIISFYLIGGLSFFAFSVPIILFVQKFIYSSQDYHPVTGYYMKPLAAIFSIYPILILIVIMAFSGILIKHCASNRVVVNLCCVALVSYVFLTTKHFIMQRISDYFFIAIVLALPLITDALRVTKQEKERLQEQKLCVAECVKEKKDASTHKDTLAFLSRKMSDKQYYFNITTGFFIIIFVLVQLFIGFKNYHNVFPYQSLWDRDTTQSVEIDS